MHQLCLPAPCPPGWPQGHVPRDQWSPVDEDAGAQLPRGSWAILSCHLGGSLDSNAWSAGTSRMTNSAAATCQKTPSFPSSQFILFIEKDRRISKRLGRFPRFIMTVLGHSYTEDCSPSCLWEVPIALGWVIYTLYHKRVSGKALRSGGLISEDNRTSPCSLWVTVLNHSVEKAKFKGSSLLLTPVRKQWDYWMSWSHSSAQLVMTEENTASALRNWTCHFKA